MYKELFESSFYHTFEQQGDNLFLIETKHVGEFSLTDSLACVDCIYKCSEDEKQREQIKVLASNTVYSMKLDQVFILTRENLGKNCDYIIGDTSTVALIEMTCSNTDYVIGKRVDAKRQLYNTLCVLNSNPDIRNHIERKIAKYVVFSWRDTGNHYSPDDAERSMGYLTAMTDEVYSPDNVSKFDFGFMYKEIRYPDRLNWDNLKNRQ
jgi:hypothetical protein